MLEYLYGKFFIPTRLWRWKTQYSETLAYNTKIMKPFLSNTSYFIVWGYMFWSLPDHQQAFLWIKSIDLLTWFVERPDYGHVRIETCSLAHNKIWCVRQKLFILVLNFNTLGRLWSNWHIKFWCWGITQNKAHSIYKPLCDVWHTHRHDQKACVWRALHGGCLKNMYTLLMYKEYPWHNLRLIFGVNLEGF